MSTQCYIQIDDRQFRWALPGFAWDSFTRCVDKDLGLRRMNWPSVCKGRTATPATRCCVLHREVSILTKLGKREYGVDEEAPGYLDNDHENEETPNNSCEATV